MIKNKGECEELKQNTKALFKRIICFVLILFHSGRGCQYSSKGYREMLEKNSIISSMSRPGCPYDNSCSESFFATIKKSGYTEESMLQWRK